MLIEILHNLIAQVAPIFGVSIDDENDKGTWLINFQPQATEQQRNDALQIMATFDIQAVRDRLQRIADRQRDAESQAGLAAQLKTVTPQQAVDYIETNVTNLASAKAAMKIMVRMLIALRDKVMPDLPET